MVNLAGVYEDECGGGKFQGTGLVFAILNNHRQVICSNLSMQYAIIILLRKPNWCVQALQSKHRNVVFPKMHVSKCINKNSNVPYI